MKASTATTKTQRQRKPRPKPARSIKWLTTPLSPEKPYGAVKLTCGKLTHAYYVNELPAADGRGFELEKIELATALEERTAYHVFLHANGQDRHCDCRGHARWGHCKHADGLAALLAR
jgi:hypothetical protein